MFGSVLTTGEKLLKLSWPTSEIFYPCIYSTFPSKTEKNVDHFCIQIRSASEQDIINYLNKSGIEVVEFVIRYGAQGEGNSIYIKDPVGNGVELKCKI